MSDVGMNLDPFTIGSLIFLVLPVAIWYLWDGVLEREWPFRYDPYIERQCAEERLERAKQKYHDKIRDINAKEKAAKAKEKVS